MNDVSILGVVLNSADKQTFVCMKVRKSVRRLIIVTCILALEVTVNCHEISDCFKTLMNLCL